MKQYISLFLGGEPLHGMFWPTKDCIDKFKNIGIDLSEDNLKKMDAVAIYDAPSERLDRYINMITSAGWDCIGIISYGNDLIFNFIKETAGVKQQMLND